MVLRRQISGLIPHRRMRPRWHRCASWLVLSLAPVVALASDPTIGRFIEDSRAVTAELVKRVGGEMRREIEYGSASSAVLVCKYSSPEIASELSRKTGWRISRVSLRPRNPAMGTPDAWEQEVLQKFDEAVGRGDKADTLEHGEIVTEPSGRFFRYMKALPVAPLCLGCHGPAESIAPNIRDRIATEYPFDKATGYRTGEVRGAVTIKRPLGR